MRAGPSSYIFEHKEVPPYYSQIKMIPPPDIWDALFRKLTCGPTKLTRTKGFVNLVNINDSSCSDHMMSIQRPSCFFNLWSSCSSRPNQRRQCCLLLPPVSDCAATTSQAIPLLTHTPCYSAATAASRCSRTSEPSYSSPHGHPLPRLPRLHVVPFLGLAVIHRRGALGAAWSTWSTTDFHRKSTVRGEADSWVHGTRKEVLPYYAQNNYSST